MMKTFTKVASVLFVAIMALGAGNLNAQDGCVNALPIACGDVVNGTTVGASASDGPTCLTTVGTGGSHWYVFTGTGDLINFTTAGSAYDTKIHVYTGTCGAYTCVTGNDDFGGLQSSVDFLSALGTNYLLVVGGFGTNSGVYTATLTCAAVAGGCTNAIACNFDPAATVDDGTCEFVSCAGCTDPTGCNFDPLATLDNGTCDFSCNGCDDPLACNFSPLVTNNDGSCCLENCITLVVTGGTFPGEVGWSLTDALGAVVAVGGVTDGVVCLAGGCYIFGMTDGFGDGWNGATYTFSDAGGVIITGNLDTATTGDGTSFGSEVLSIGTGCVIGCTDALACNFDPLADFDFGCESLSCAGCTDPLASNFDPAATIDDGTCVNCLGGELLAIIDMTDAFGDGWNGATWNIFDDLGTLVASGDLDTAPVGDGSSVGTASACVIPGCYTFQVTGGTFPGEVGWSLSDALGNAYGAGGPGSAEVDFGFTGGCAIEGCTDSNCGGYNPSATIDDGSCICPPANNDVCDAEAITCGISVTGTTIASTDNEGLIGSICGGTDVSSPGVWYEYNAAADEQVIVGTCNSAVGGDTKIHVYVAAPDCNNLICVGSNDDACAFLSEIAFNAQTGNDYFILVSEFGAGFGQDFTLDVTCQSCPGIPANDDCVDALPQINGVPSVGSLCCASPSDAPNFVAGFNTAYDVFFVFNSLNYDTFNFDLTNISSSEVGLVIYTGACGTLVDEVGCLVTGQCAGDISDFLTLTPNTDYYFAVFTTDPALCGDFSFTTSGEFLGCTDGTADNFDPIATLDDGSCVFTNPAVNDLCADAIAVTCNSSTVGSTGGSTATGAPTLLPCDAAPGSGVWYTLPATADLVTISTCGSVIDSKINVWTSVDCAGPFACVDQVDGTFASEAADFGSCGFFDQDDTSVSFVGDGVSTYYIYVGAQDVDGNPLTDDNGAFVMDITCEVVVEGCTNSVAYNYNPAANIEDGSCDFFSLTCVGAGTPVQINMYDAFGDGWDLGTYVLTDGAGTVIATNTIDNGLFVIDEDNFAGGESGFDLVCLQDGCYTITVAGSAFPFETAIDIVDEFGVIIAAEGTPAGGNAIGDFSVSFTIGAAVCGCTDPGACNFDVAATDEDGSCEYVTCAGCTDPLGCNFDIANTIDDGSCCFENCLTVSMADSFGDGWNGNFYEIYTIDDVLVASGDLDNAQEGDGLSTGTDVLCLPDGCYYIAVVAGAFTGEVSWNLFGTNNGIVGGGSPVAAGDITFSLGAGACVVGCVEPVACNFDPAANIADCDACEYATCLGCTYADATNFDPLSGASIDDGSCLFDTVNPCPEDLNGDGLINATDLLQFLGAFGSSC
jgi:hypothetical protein